MDSNNSEQRLRASIQRRAKWRWEEERKRRTEFVEDAVWRVESREEEE